MQLRELQVALGGRILGAANPSLGQVRLHSGQVGPGDLFAALPGAKSNGSQFAADAVQRGAAALLVPEPFDSDAVPQWVHPQARRTAGEAAALLLGDPSAKLKVCGITGTNGKTTTAHILGSLLDAAGLVPAVLGTAGNRLAGTGLEPATHTTPDGPSLQALLARHLQAGGRSVAAEVSSHGLTQERHAGLRVDVAVFTNLSPEHLDYHGDMVAYAQAKARLFHSLKPGTHAVLHLDDPAADIMAAAARDAGARVWTYSVRQSADLCACSLRTSPSGMRFEVEGMGICSKELLLPLQGRFNVENALAAALAARVMGASSSAVLDGLATTSSIPGRLEGIPNDLGISLLVDYAHSPDALRRVLAELRAGTRQRAARLLCVFGCGGDRDQGKRRLMGACAAELADLVVVTSDNPRSEDPQAIADLVLAGARESGADCEVHCELDRRQAIGLALAAARPGDVVLVAGKGHETGQQFGDTVLPFDDRRVAQEMLA